MWRAPYIHEFPSQKFGGILWLLKGVTTLPVICLVIYVGLVHDKIVLCFTIGEAMGQSGVRSQNAGKDSATVSS